METTNIILVSIIALQGLVNLYLFYRIWKEDKEISQLSDNQNKIATILKNFQDRLKFRDYINKN